MAIAEGIDGGLRDNFNMAIKQNPDFDYPRIFRAAAKWELKRAWWWHRDMSDTYWIKPFQQAYQGTAEMVTKQGGRDNIVEKRWLTKAQVITMKLDGSW